MTQSAGSTFSKTLPETLLVGASWFGDGSRSNTMSSASFLPRSLFMFPTAAIEII
jgi:hypothetical protein